MFEIGNTGIYYRASGSTTKYRPARQVLAPRAPSERGSSFVQASRVWTHLRRLARDGNRPAPRLDGQG